MVGVAGKSLACNTCKKRRVKCDLGRPSCLKCTSSNRVCTGYGRDLIFVNRTPSSRLSTATSVLSKLKADQERKDALVDSKTEARLRYLFSESAHNSHEFRKYAVKVLEITYLPKEQATNNLHPETSKGSIWWIYHLTDLTEPSKPLDAALFAFCLAQLHITGRGSATLYQCLDQYSAALQSLYTDLEDPNRRSREETLAAILLLSTCEFFICNTETGWSAHIRGIVQILRLRDPGMVRTPAWRHLFSRLRVVCTIDALIKQRCPFPESEKRLQLRELIPESDYSDPLDELFQLLAYVPRLMCAAVALPSISDQTILLKESAAVIQSILAMAKTLELWHDEFCRVSPTPRYWLVPSCTTNPADGNSSDKVFPSCFRFESVGVSLIVSMYWSAAAQLYSHVIQIHDLVQARLGHRIELEDLLAQADISEIDAASTLEALSQNAQVPTIAKGRSIQDIQNEGTKLAHYVCQSMEYYHQVDLGTFGSQATSYPTWSVRQYFRLHPGHEREWLWLQNMHKMEGPGTFWGWRTMAFADLTEPLGS